MYLGPFGFLCLEKDIQRCCHAARSQVCLSRGMAPEGSEAESTLCPAHMLDNAFTVIPQFHFGFAIAVVFVTLAVRTGRSERVPSPPRWKGTQCKR